MRHTRPVWTGFGLPGNKTKGWNVFPIKRMRSEGGTDYETLEKQGAQVASAAGSGGAGGRDGAARRRGYGPKTLARSGFSESGRAALLCDSAGQCHPIWTLVGGRGISGLAGRPGSLESLY